MRVRIVLLFILLTGGAIAQNKLPSWDNLKYRAYPRWFTEAKLGIFVHWGLYSVPSYASKEGYGEWFNRGLMVKDSGRCKIMSLYADTSLSTFEQYKQLTNYWHAELWNPHQWARIFRDAGARYVLLVAKHHDGYCLWDSKYQPEWNSVASGPHRNIVKELTEAVQKEGMHMGFYYSLPEWTNPRHVWMQDPDSAIGDYVNNYMVPQFKELVSLYHPEVMFADGDWQNLAEEFRSAELINWYYDEVGPEAIVNDRWGRGTQHGFKTPEYSEGLYMESVPWAECRGIGRSFGFNRNEDLDNYITDKELIQHFCWLVAHGGGMTLNVGPMADGTIPLIQQERLRTLGKWLEVNGEAIYGASGHRGSLEGISNDVRCKENLPPSTAIDYDWVRNAPMKGVPVDLFRIQWKGDVVFPEEGDYIFKVEGDDEVRVSSELGDTMLLYRKDWVDNSMSQRTLHMKKGERMSFCVDYYEKDLEAKVAFKWSLDGGKSFQPVYSNWCGTVYWHRTTRCFTDKDDTLYMIEFERPNTIVEIEHGPSLPKNTKITLLGTSGTVKWRQGSNRKLTLDLSEIPQKEINNLDHAWVFKIVRKMPKPEMMGKKNGRSKVKQKM